MSLDNQEKVLKVIDSSLTLEHPKRIHQLIINGEITDIVFNYGEDKFLPESVAMKFAKEGFRIVHPDSEAEVEIPREIPYGAPVQLHPDEVIAKFTELTFEALRTRAVILPGGEKFVKEGYDSQDIIAFLMGTEPTIDGDEELGELEDEEGDDTDENLTKEQGAVDPNANAENPAPTTEGETGSTDANADENAKDPQGQVDAEKTDDATAADADANAAPQITEYKEGE